jgi:DNA (cytosine-5)-methyltransferase 1
MFRDIRTNSPIAIDLFSGVGGLSLGLAQAGFDVAIKVEIEEIAGRYAQYNAPQSKVLYGEVQGDVRRFGKKAMEDLGFERKEIALVAGGPPCQGFSLAGKQRIDDPLNDLVLEFGRVVVELNPMAFLMENVPGITTSGSEKLRETLNLLGQKYQICGPTKLNAWDFGVPQTRQRVFLFGIRRDLKIVPSLPLATHSWSEFQQLAFLPATPNCWDAISDLPDVERYPFLVSSDRVAYDKAPLNDYQKVMRGLLVNGSDNLPLVEWDSTICTNCRLTQHGPDLLERLTALGHGKADKVSGIRRMVPTSLAPTIRAGTTKERGSWSAPRPLHPFSNRVLTTRECARIQTFPDWFVFHPAKWHGNRMVGNAVPPLFAKAIGAHILTTLGLERRGFDMAIPRDQSLISLDIEKAAASNYEGRRVSQKVSSWSPRKKELSIER